MGVQAALLACECSREIFCNRKTIIGKFVYESFNKVPFFGSIMRILMKKKTSRNGGGSLLGNIIDLFTTDRDNKCEITRQAIDFTAFLNISPTKSGESSKLSLFDFADNNHYVRKIKKSNYKEVADKLTKSDSKFTDD